MKHNPDMTREEAEQQTGAILGFWQDGGGVKWNPYIPINKALFYRTTTLNNDPSGRSILRNAYKAYTYLNRLQDYEAIAIERELHGIPVGRMPADCLHRMLLIHINLYGQPLKMFSVM